MEVYAINNFKQSLIARREVIKESFLSNCPNPAENNRGLMKHHDRPPTYRLQLNNKVQPLNALQDTSANVVRWLISLPHSGERNQLHLAVSLAEYPRIPSQNSRSHDPRRMITRPPSSSPQPQGYLSALELFPSSLH